MGAQPGAIARLDTVSDALNDLPGPDGLTFSAAGNLYATHGLLAFAARCPPALISGLGHPALQPPR